MTEKKVGLQSYASLKKLHISFCPELQFLTQVGLQHFTSLEELCIPYCPKLQYLTKERLPAIGADLRKVKIGVI